MYEQKKTLLMLFVEPSILLLIIFTLLVYTILFYKKNTQFKKLKKSLTFI